MAPARPQIQVTLRGPVDGGNFGPLIPDTRTVNLQGAIDSTLDQGRRGLHRAERRSTAQNHPHNLNLVDNLRGTRPEPQPPRPPQPPAFDAVLHSDQSCIQAPSDSVRFRSVRPPTWRRKVLQ